MTTEVWTAWELDSDLRDRAETVAETVWNEHDLADRLEPYRPMMEGSELGDVPTLHIDDLSGIPFVADVSGVEEYQHRARIRAGDGDAVVVATEPPPGYERYNREYLGLGGPEWVVVPGGEDPLEVARGCRRGESFEKIADWARDERRVRIEPFMAIEPIWQLASRLEERGVDVSVRGPPPPVLWIANDKLCMAQIADRLFESTRTVEAHTASDPETMAERLLELAEESDRVALKRTRCASAMGNKVFASDELLAADEEKTVGEIRRFLRHTGWPEGRDVLLMRWLATSVSPSTQGVVPPAGEGPPLVDGVYEQLLEGGASVFAGSRPADLPEELVWRLVETSLAMLCVLQRLGYVGRCSFDFVVSGPPEGDCTVHVVDFNGRWGGTSLPMQLVDRLVAGERPPYRAQDFVHSQLVGAAFSDVVEACADHLYRAESGEGRFILYNPGPLAEHGKFDVISLGSTQREAEEGVERVLPRLLELDPH